MNFESIHFQVSEEAKVSMNEETEAVFFQILSSKIRTSGTELSYIFPTALQRQYTPFWRWRIEVIEF
jgi:hypothetical protein